MLAALIVGCFSLSGCGDSSTGSPDGSSASTLSTSNSSSEAGGSVNNQSAGGVAIGDVNTNSAKALRAFPPSAQAGISGKATVKALETMSVLPSFGTGTLAVGSDVTRVIGTYPGATPIAGRRYRNDVLIAGATGASYKITEADVGQPLVYEELVERTDDQVRTWYRSAEVLIGDALPTASKAPSFGSGGAVGEAMTRVVGEYPGSTPVAGRRYRNGVLIPGATAADYIFATEDVGQEMVYEEEAQHNETLTRKWFRSAAVTATAAVVVPVPVVPAPATPVVADPAPVVPVPADPVPKGGTVNSADVIVSDMSEINDFILKGYESFKNGWYVGPGVNSMGSDPSFSNSPSWSIFYNNPDYVGKVAEAALPWVVIFDGVDHAASNVAVEIRNMLTYIKSKSSGTWVLLGGPSHTTGTYYGKPNTGLPALDEVVTASGTATTSIKVPEDRGYFWHGWWAAGRLSVNPSDIAAMYVTVQARLVVADPARPDDRAQAQVGLQVGADYYLTTTSIYPEAYAPAVGINRTKTVTNDWKAFNFTTISDVGVQDPGGGITQAELRAAPPPLE